MARRRNEIFAHNNKYERNIFKRIGSWFGRLKGWQKGIFIGLIVILIIVIGVAGYVLAKLGLINRVDIDETQLSCVDVDGYVNILLLGVDSRDMDNIEGSGADAIMILSLKEETGEVKLMSVYRDTYLKFGDTDTYGKITDANRYGGPGHDDDFAESGYGHRYQQVCSGKLQGCFRPGKRRGRNYGGRSGRRNSAAEQIYHSDG